MSATFPFMQDFLQGSREIRLLSNIYGHPPTGLESSTTPQLQLHLPEVLAPAQYLIDVGLRPALARRLSSTYMNFVDRYKKTCQSHFDHAARGGHLTEYYREVFTVLFRRTTRTWDSQIVSIARVQLRQAGVQATVRTESVNIRVDDAMKAEIMLRLGLKAPLTFDKMVTSPNKDVTSRLKGVSEQTHATSINTIDSRLMLSELSPISSTEVTLRPLDPFCQSAPPTCFPAPYPPPPEHSSSHSPDRALATTFVPLAPPRNVRSLTSYSPDVSSLTDLFDRMTITTLKADLTNSKHHRMSGISELDKMKPVPSPIAEKISKERQLASIESNASPPKSIAPVRRRKIAALPTRRGKISASPSLPAFDSAGATSYPIPRPYERVTEETPVHIPASPQKTRLVSTFPPAHTAEAPYFATPNYSSPSQRKAHTLRKTVPQSPTIIQTQTSKPLSTSGETFSYNVSQTPPFLSDATSYYDSPPTSSDELDTPPSTPPTSHVLLASTSTESLDISSESDGIVSHKESLGNAKLPYPRQRYRRLDFMKGGLCRDEQPLTFTFSV